MEIKETWQIEQEHLEHKGQTWEEYDHKKWIPLEEYNKIIEEIIEDLEKYRCGEHTKIIRKLKNSKKKLEEK